MLIFPATHFWKCTTHRLLNRKRDPSFAAIEPACTECSFCFHRSRLDGKQCFVKSLNHRYHTLPSRHLLNVGSNPTQGFQFCNVWIPFQCFFLTLKKHRPYTRPEAFWLNLFVNVGRFKFYCRISVASWRNRANFPRHSRAGFPNLATCTLRVHLPLRRGTFKVSNRR